MTRRTRRLPFSATRRKRLIYTQITAAERYILARFRHHHVPLATIARLLGRHRSTLYREIRRNRNATHNDGAYRSALADSYARTRRFGSHRNQRLTPADWAQVYTQLRKLWSPEQIAGRFRAAPRRAGHMVASPRPTAMSYPGPPRARATQIDVPQRP